MPRWGVTYKQRVPDTLIQPLREGVTNTDVGRALGVTRRTICRYRNQGWPWHQFEVLCLINDIDPYGYYKEHRHDPVD